MNNAEAYERLTRVLTNMHASERDLLDASPQYDEIMRLVKVGRDGVAANLAHDNCRTVAGDAWRVKRGLIGADGAFFN